MSIYVALTRIAKDAAHYKHLPAFLDAGYKQLHKGGMLLSFKFRHQSC